MNKTYIGILLILSGTIYGSFIFQKVFDFTLGPLVKYGWIKPPKRPEGKEKDLYGPAASIIFFSLTLIIIGIYLIWTEATQNLQ